jgi:hypothetical protein
MPTIESKSVHEISLNKKDLEKLENGQSIEVQVDNSIIRLRSTLEPETPSRESEDVELEEIKELQEEAEKEVEDKGDIVPQNLEERDTGGSSERKTTADGEPKPFTNDDVKIGNDEENLSGMVQKE